MLCARVLVRHDPGHSVFIISLRPVLRWPALARNPTLQGAWRSYALLPVSRPGYCTEEEVIYVSGGSVQKGILYIIKCISTVVLI